MALTKYRHILIDRLVLNDNEWNFTVPNLPNDTDCNQAGLIKTCSLVANVATQALTLSFTKLETNRAISNRPPNHFIHVTCDNFRLQTEDGKSATFHESSDYISRFLKSGVSINGVHYSFYGHSNSQLKSKSCVLMAGSQAEVDNVVESMGDFSKMKTVAKKAKRIALLFSTTHTEVNVEPARCRDVADVERDDYNFTDGCGKISRGLAYLLSQKKPILFRDKRYHPSVFQIRYRGYKGVVMIEPKLGPKIQLELRKSMRKFSGGADHSFAVVGYSKPYTYGYLNDETVLLLHSLGIDADTIARKQREHLEFLQSADTNEKFAFRFLSSMGDIENTEELLMKGLESVRKVIQKRVGREHANMLNKKSENKCRILIPKSRMLFGVCDPYDILQEGQCFVKPTLDAEPVSRPLSGTFVLVARNPCLHPGDLQKLCVVAEPRLSHLTDCIVFPTRGRRPAADMMSGGDLDGDQFFVTWDSDIIPSIISEAAEYPGAKEPIQFKRITSQHRIDYFARSSSMQLGQIKNLYLRWARCKGSLSEECQQLNRLFSQCVDANQIKIPKKLKNTPDCLEQTEPFILDYLHDLAKKQINLYTKSIHVDNFDSEDLLLTALTQFSNISQFELAELTHRWCQKKGARFSDYWQYFDHTSFSTEERIWFGSLLPATKTNLEIVNNDLMHSDILSHEELAAVGLKPSKIRWRCLFRSSEDRIANLLDSVEKSFPYFTRKLLVLQCHDRLSIAIYLPKMIQPDDEFPLNGAGRLFAFPHQKHALNSSRINVLAKHNARFIYTRTGFRLYEGKDSNTFIFFRKSQNDDSEYKNVDGKGEKARLREQTIQNGINHEWIMSIALQKFSDDLRRHIVKLKKEGVINAELYAISNRDTRSFRSLDLWLEQIDTDKVHHNFEHDGDGDLSRSTIANLDWSKESELVVLMAKNNGISAIGTTATQKEVSRVLDIAWSTGDSQLAARVCSTWTDRLCKLSVITSRDQGITANMIQHLRKTPWLVIYFVKLCPWSSLHPNVRNALLPFATNMTEALILCADTMGRLVVDKLKLVLAELTVLSTDQLNTIMKLAALTIKSPETALNVLVEAIQPFSTKLLLETPRNSEYKVRMLAAIAIDHIEEAQDVTRSTRSTPYHWRFKHPVEFDGAAIMLRCDYRIDAPKSEHLVVGHHVRFVCVKPPEGVITTEYASFEGLVDKWEVGQILLRCQRHPPAFYQRCSWEAEVCGSFVTSQTMMDAVTKLFSRKQACCGVFHHLFPSSETKPKPAIVAPSTTDMSRLNPSQYQAVSEALAGPLTCIWGPPGTGKTHTIVSIINQMLKSGSEQRLLITAPTHNAVDNVMRQYLRYSGTVGLTITPLRVSTDIRKVATDLQSHTCDAMLGKDINQDFSARRKAQKRIRQARLVFTTCIGASLGLLRDEHFHNIIIDEASQQTEPMALVPLVKGAARAILVGDHVQLRATVQPNAQALNYDFSLFERLWTESTSQRKQCAVRKVMLDTQYRMHPEICAFPSREFYEGKLLTAKSCRSVILPESAFRWPDSSRTVFIQSPSVEDLGRKSKSNSGQTKLCKEVVHELRSAKSAESEKQEQLVSQRYSIAILTPYTRQAEELQRLLPDETISSIDGYQGQEADVIVYVTVRCNAHREIGFLKDMRRLNVALTRARGGLIVIGNEDTLTGKGKILRNGEQLEECHLVWKRLIGRMSKLELRKELGPAQPK